MERNIEDEIRLIEASIHGEEGKQGEEPEEEIYHVYDVPGGIVILREGEEAFAHNVTVIDSDVSGLDTVPLAAKPQPQDTLASTGLLPFGVFVILLCLMSIMFQFYVIANPYTVTIILDEREKQLSLTGTLQLGRLISPITLSQSATANTTGHGHQDAKQATGFITFYNGQPAQQFVPAGVLLTSRSGMQIVTTQDAAIPAADLTAHPPVFGQVTVAAQAQSTGGRGNIAAYDINEPCCATSVVAQNLNSFSGGQDERDYQTVSPGDITNASTPLKAALDQSMPATLTGQLKSGEVLTSQHCTPTTTADHQTGQEATQVKVTVSETCTAIVYNSQVLTSNVTELLTAQATKKFGTGYSMLDTPQLNVTGARAQKNAVVVSFTAQSAWIYALSVQQQQAIKKLIVEKTTEQAIELLDRLPGVERVSLQSSGFGDATRLPKNLNTIHLMILYGL